MDGYVRKRDRWGATEQVESTIELSAGPSLYNDTLHCAINKSMGNTCSALLMMEILARHYFASPACIDKIRLKLNVLAVTASGSLRARCQQEVLEAGSENADRKTED